MQKRLLLLDLPEADLGQICPAEAMHLYGQGLVQLLLKLTFTDILPARPGNLKRYRASKINEALAQIQVTSSTAFRKPCNYHYVMSLLQTPRELTAPKNIGLGGWKASQHRDFGCLFAPLVIDHLPCRCDTDAAVVRIWMCVLFCLRLQYLPDEEYDKVPQGTRNGTFENVYRQWFRRFKGRNTMYTVHAAFAHHDKVIHYCYTIATYDKRSPYRLFTTMQVRQQGKDGVSWGSSMRFEGSYYHMRRCFNVTNRNVVKTVMERRWTQIDSAHHRCANITVYRRYRGPSMVNDSLIYTFDGNLHRFYCVIEGEITSAL